MLAAYIYGIWSYYGNIFSIEFELIVALYFYDMRRVE